MESFDDDQMEEPRLSSTDMPNKPHSIDTNYLDSIDSPASTQLSNKPTNINANYLESFDNDANDASSLKKSATTHDLVDDYMSYIHKQDAVDEAYAKHYYKNNNNPLASSTASMFESDNDLGNFEKKSLKSKSKKGAKKGQEKERRVHPGLEQEGVNAKGDNKGVKSLGFRGNENNLMKGQRMRHNKKAGRKDFRENKQNKNVELMNSGQEATKQKIKRKKKQERKTRLKVMSSIGDEKVAKSGEKNGKASKLAKNGKQGHQQFKGKIIEKQNLKNGKKKSREKSKQAGRQGIKGAKNVKQEKNKSERKMRDKSMNIL